MYADPISLDLGSLNSVDFFRKTANGNQSHYVAETATDDDEMLLRILHGTGAKDKKDPNFINKRHVATLAWNKLNDDAQRREACILNLSLTLPNTGTFTRANVDDMCTAIATLMADDTFKDKLLRGEL